MGDDGTDGQAEDRLTIIAGSDAGDRGVFIDAPGTALSGIDIYKRSQQNNYLRILGPNGRPIAQFGSGGQFETAAWITVSGVIAEDGANRTFVHPTDRPYMLGVFSDVLGPSAVFRSNIYAGIAGESWPISVISGQGRERLRIDDGGDILLGNISGNDVAGERLQLRLGRAGDSALLLQRNDLGLAPARYLVEASGWYGGLDSNGGEVRLLGLSSGGITIGDAARAISLAGTSVALQGVLTLASLDLAAAPPAPAGSLAYCAECAGGAVLLSNGRDWKPFALGLPATVTVGDGAPATASGSLAIAIGAGAAGSHANAVAIGAGSATVAANTVAVGAIGNERRITSLAAGQAATDAVNKAQLDALGGTVDSRLASLTGVLGGQVQAQAALEAAQIEQATKLTAHDDLLALHGEALATQAAQLVAQDETLTLHGQTLDAHGVAIAALEAAGAGSAAKLAVLASGDSSAKATASGAAALAVGNRASAAGADTLAVGGDASASAAGATALGADSVASGAKSLAGGLFARALGEGSVAVGRAAFADSKGGVAVGALASASGTSATAMGEGANAAGAETTAIGAHAASLAPKALAVGASAAATGREATALGATAVAAQRAVGIGSAAQATGEQAIAIGADAEASGYAASAMGAGARATGYQAMANGVFARALGDQAMAFGRAASAAGESAVAVGALSSAGQTRATAIGAGAVASGANSTAIGAGASARVANQVVLGGTGSSIRIGDIAASTTAQVGPVQAVTVDNSGVLGTTSVATAQSVQAVGASLRELAAVGDTQFDSLRGDVNTLFDLQQHDRREFRQGIAAVAAMAEPHFPSEAGRTSYASNIAVYRGEVGFSAGVSHRFEGDFALSAGATFGAGKNTAVRAGVAGEF